jgi:hypothetical protein
MLAACHAEQTPPMSPPSLGSLEPAELIGWVAWCSTARLGGGGDLYDLTCLEARGVTTITFATDGCIKSIAIDGKSEPAIERQLGDLQPLLSATTAKLLETSLASNDAALAPDVAMHRGGRPDEPRATWVGACHVPLSAQPTPSPFGLLSVERMFALASTCNSPLHVTQPQSFETVTSCEESLSPRIGWELAAYTDGRIDRLSVFDQDERGLRARARALVPLLVPPTESGRFEASLWAQHGDVIPSEHTVISISRSLVVAPTWIAWNAHLGL